ncbi:MAG TPA: TonB-dependent receptor, partial [Micropepsaceae bacterium]|nr:TonB-dependent receptor [Micropepsaceae bacterium]
YFRTGLMTGAGLAILATDVARAQTGNSVPEQVLIQGPRSVAERDQLPTTVESVTFDELTRSVNVTNTEDALKYLPNILVRKRHVGDTQAPVTTRTSGVGSSARSLIYADGVLLSALIGNNNSFASPRWGMVAPNEIERIDVLYGPFAAEYPGNSIGAVIEIATRMPDQYVASARVQAVVQDFFQYATQSGNPAYELSGLIGDRLGKFAWRASVNHLYSRSQPLAYVTATRPASTATTGTPVTGAFADLNRTGGAIAVLGAGGLEHQYQDNLTLKLAYDLSPGVTAAYTAGLFLNDDKAGVQTYLQDAAGNPVYSGSLNIAGYNYSIAAGAFSNNIYRLEETHWMHSLSLKSDTQGTWDWQIVGSLYDYDTDRQRIPSAALPGAFAGGSGAITDMGGTGWYTLDAKALWRPGGLGGANQLSFGAHGDRYTLSNLKYNTSNWLAGSPGALATAANGKTTTYGLWLQDVWRFAPDFKLTLGLRYESWRAYHGFNSSLVPVLSVMQPKLSSSDVSPKASLAWQVTQDWSAKASFGSAYRYPTVTELYQAVTTGAVLTVPNPNLKPEHALSGELAIERRITDGKFRLSLFEEDISDALISQSAPLLPGSTTLFNYVQNIDHVRSHGVEGVFEQNDVFIDGLALQASLTYVDPRIVSDPAFPAAVGKRIPQVPAWRGTFVASYRPDERWTFTAAARYSTRVYGTIDNSDIYTHTYQGFDGYFVVDARVNYQIDSHWNAALGIDNLNDRKYFLFHPFPQRSVVAELTYNY